MWETIQVEHLVAPPRWLAQAALRVTAMVIHA